MLPDVILKMEHFIFYLERGFWFYIGEGTAPTNPKVIEHMPFSHIRRLVENQRLRVAERIDNQG